MPPPNASYGVPPESLGPRPSQHRGPYLPSGDDGPPALWPWRILAAIPLILWLPFGVWFVATIYTAAPQAKTQSTALLLVPTLLLAAAAAVMLLVPRRLDFGLAMVLLFSIIGVPVWAILHPSAGKTHWLSPAFCTAITWTTIALLAYLILVAGLRLRKRPGPSDVHVSEQFVGAPGWLPMTPPPGAGPMVDEASPDDGPFGPPRKFED
jgi:hypothetical protein